MSSIRTKPASAEYDSGWDRIFGNKGGGAAETQEAGPGPTAADGSGQPLAANSPGFIVDDNPFGAGGPPA